MSQRLAMIPVADLALADNVREHDVDPELAGLADSIREVGVLEPLVVWPSADGTRAEVGMGQRRLKAARLAGLDTVPCLLRPRPDERERIVMQLAENLERKTMSPIDEGRAVAELNRMGVPQWKIAQTMHRTMNWIRQRLDLLRLPDPIKAAVHAGTLPPTVALEFPPALIDFPAVAQAIADTEVLDASALRAAIRKGVNVAGPAGNRPRQKGVRVVPVPDHSAYDLAKRRAAEDGLTLGEWTVRAIVHYAETRP